jgi:hypothetical protein
MIFDCVQARTVSAVSAMVFMEGSETAATLALENQIDTGLHLNFTTPLNASRCPAAVAEAQIRVCRYLRSSKLAQLVYHPGLRSSFDRVFKAQVEEYHRLYGRLPERLDGHHHMHLCANVRSMLPSGTVVRRSFSFLPGEKGSINLAYRRILNRGLGRRHRLVDYLFSFPPLTPLDRLQTIGTLANEFVVELETHPAHPEEYEILRRGNLAPMMAQSEIRSFATVFELGRG